MKVRIQVVIDTEEHAPEVVEEIACIERDTLQPETLGLTLAEAKDVLQRVQQVLVLRPSYSEMVSVGYSFVSFTRASAVVNRHSIVAWALLRRSVHAVVSCRRAS
jgi:hypothetical protein